MLKFLYEHSRTLEQHARKHVQQALRLHAHCPKLYGNRPSSCRWWVRKLMQVVGQAQATDADMPGDLLLCCRQVVRTLPQQTGMLHALGQALAWKMRMCCTCLCECWGCLRGFSMIHYGPKHLS